MILFYACLGLYTFSGPLKPTHTTILDPNCINHTWSALLYVNNVIDPLKEVGFDRVRRMLMFWESIVFVLGSNANNFLKETDCLDHRLEIIVRWMIMHSPYFNLMIIHCDIFSMQ